MAMNVAARVLTSAKGGGFFDLLAPGLYAWGVTVAWPVSQRFAPLEARILAFVAVAALVAGAILARFWPSAARIAGTWFFLASCVGVWALFAPSIAPSHLDPVQGVLGSLGWALFAIAWGGQKTPASRPPRGADSAAVRPGRETRRTLAFGLIVAGALMPLALAWWVVSTERALLAHAVSLAAAIALMALGVDLLAPTFAMIESQPGAGPRRDPRKRWRVAAPALMALVTLALAGAAYGLLR